MLVSNSGYTYKVDRDSQDVANHVGMELMNWTVELQSLPAQFPTHSHDSVFWEKLGRAVATFGFLEEVLGKAIFSFTATRPCDMAKIDAEFEEWIRDLERALTDSLGKLIGDFKIAVKEHPQGEVHGLDDLVLELHKASRIRNILCHGSWQIPDEAGASTPSSSRELATCSILRSTANISTGCKNMSLCSRAR